MLVYIRQCLAFVQKLVLYSFDSQCIYRILVDPYNGSGWITSALSI